MRTERMYLLATSTMFAAPIPPSIVGNYPTIHGPHGDVIENPTWQNMFDYDPNILGGASKKLFEDENGNDIELWTIREPDLNIWPADLSILEKPGTSPANKVVTKNIVRNYLKTEE